MIDSQARASPRSPIRSAARVAQVDDLSRHACRGSVSLARAGRRRADPPVDQRGERARAAVSRSDPGARGDQAAHDAAVELRALRHSRCTAAIAISICATTACRTRACCMSRTACSAQPRVLLDPNTLSKDATVALGEIVPSPDGKVLAYSLSDGGTDWRTWHFRDVATGTDLPDVLRFIKFALVSWTADSRSVYYARYPLRADGSGDDSKQREIYWHRMGAAQEADERVFKVVDHPTRNPYVQVSDDGRYLILWLYDGSQSRPASITARSGRTARPPAKSCGCSTLSMRTTSSSPRSTIRSTCARRRGRPNCAADRRAGDVGRAQELARDHSGERQHSMIETSIVGGRIFAQYLQDAHSVVRAIDLNGKPLYDVKLPGFGQRQRFLRRREGQRDVLRLHRLPDAAVDFAPGRRDRRGQRCFARRSSPSTPARSSRSRCSIAARTARACRCSSPASATW